MRWLFAAIILLLSSYKCMTKGATPYVYFLGKSAWIIWIRCQGDILGAPGERLPREEEERQDSIPVKHSSPQVRLPAFESGFCHRFSAWNWQCPLVLCRAKSLQSCLTLCFPMDCSPTSSSVHGVLQARILEWVAMSFSKCSYIYLHFIVNNQKTMLRTENPKDRNYCWKISTTTTPPPDSAEGSCVPHSQFLLVCKQWFSCYSCKTTSDLFEQPHKDLFQCVDVSWVLPCIWFYQNPSFQRWGDTGKGL